MEHARINGETYMWLIIIGLMLAAFAGGLLYISFRAAHFAAVQRVAHGRKWLARLLCFGFFVLLTAVLWLAWNMMNAVACMIHLVLFWLICDFAAFLVEKIGKKRPKRYLAGAAAEPRTHCRECFQKTVQSPS